ncbi:MAG: HAD-IA family hydrolase [Acidobacteriaceae bacterium]|nr:HAD-IA family hydrolase [Acidobacteriaceae bacterium]
MDLAISMNATREHVGMPPLDPTLIFSFVGNGAPALVRRALGPNASEDLVQSALAYFLKFYRAHALQHTQLYPGVREVVQTLAEEGHTLAVLTNKPVRISTDIVGALKLSDFFLRVYGGDSFEQKKPDPIGIVTLQREANTGAKDTLMIGDSGVDVQTARNARVCSCGVTWGFQPEAFETDAPDYLVHSTCELLAIVHRHRAVLTPS